MGKALSLWVGFGTDTFDVLERSLQRLRECLVGMSGPEDHPPLWLECVLDPMDSLLIIHDYTAVRYPFAQMGPDRCRRLTI